MGIIEKESHIFSRRPFVVASVALPPPVNGQALVNAGVIDDLKKSCDLRIINTSPKSNARSVRYHVRRLVSVLKVPAVLLFNLVRPKRTLYTVVEPGHGMYYNAFILLFARLFRYKVFLHHHASSYTLRYDWRFNALCVLAGSNAVHIALSNQMLLDLRRHYPFCKRVIVAHNASRIVDPRYVSRVRQDDGITIGFLSNLSLEKGLDTVLQCFEDVRRSVVMTKLVLAGPTVDVAARLLLDKARSKYGSALEEMGSVSLEKKDSFFRSIDLFLFPSRYRFEAQPLVILEALSYGIPVVAIRHGYAAEIVEVLGTAVAPSDFVSFSTKFALSLSVNGSFAQRQKNAARARFEELKELSKHQNEDMLRLFQTS